MAEVIKLLITGSSGQLAQSFKIVESSVKAIDATYINKESLDISNKNALNEYFLNNQYDLIMNFAAYTAVDEAESNNYKAFNVNSSGVFNLVQVANEHDIFIIHISTDYVFDGKKKGAYTENEATNPVNVYGKSKLEGELKLKSLASNYAIIRVSWLYSEFRNNFFKTMIKLSEEKKELSIVDDQFSSPTYAVDFSRNLVKIIIEIHSKYLNQEFRETFHYSNTGVTTWHDFAKEIFRLTSSKIKIKKIDTKSLNLPAQRPLNTALDSKKITDFFNITIEDWKISLVNCVNRHKVMEE